MTVPWDWTSISKIFQILVKIWGCDSEVMLTNSCGKYFNRLVEFFVCLKYHLNTTKHAVHNSWYYKLQTSSQLGWHYFLLLSILSTSALSHSAIGHAMFVYVSLREESLLLARRCSFPLSSRVKALRHSLGEASIIWIAKKTENPLQAQSQLYDNT